MKAEDLFAWHIEIISYILKYQKTVFFIHPSLSLYSSALPNERMKAPFRFVPSLYRPKLGELFMFDALESWLVIHSFRYSGKLIHYSI